MWFTPPYNSAVATNIGKEFLRLVDTNFQTIESLKVFQQKHHQDLKQLYV